MLWRSAHGLPLDGLRACEIPNTGLNRLRWVNGALNVESWADATHLTGLAQPPVMAAAERDSGR
jgi:probable phosphoglycerate mutase